MAHRDRAGRVGPVRRDARRSSCSTRASPRIDAGQRAAQRVRARRRRPRPPARGGGRRQGRRRARTRVRWPACRSGSRTSRTAPACRRPTDRSCSRVARPVEQDSIHVGPAAGGRRGAGGQDGGAGVRHAELHQDPGLGRHAQPVGHRPARPADPRAGRRPRWRPASSRSPRRATAAAPPASPRRSAAWSGSRPASVGSRIPGPTRRRPRRSGRWSPRSPTPPAISTSPPVPTTAIARRCRRRRRVLRGGGRIARRRPACAPAGRSTSGSPWSIRRWRRIVGGRGAEALIAAAGLRGRRRARAPHRPGEDVAVVRRGRPLARARRRHVAGRRRRRHLLLPHGARADRGHDRASTSPARTSGGPNSRRMPRRCSPTSTCCSRRPPRSRRSPPRVRRPTMIDGQKVHLAMSTPFTMLANLCWNPSISVPAGLTGRSVFRSACRSPPAGTATRSPCVSPGSWSRPGPGRASPADRAIRSAIGQRSSRRGGFAQEPLELLDELAARPRRRRRRVAEVRSSTSVDLAVGSSSRRAT